jgi:hypothetical protein
MRLIAWLPVASSALLIGVGGWISLDALLRGKVL